MPEQLDKNYDPKSFEEKLYKNWEEKGYFKPSDDRSRPAFSIVIPPPNITGQLHMGHALDNTLQDILVRYKRMQGYATLWVPGTDHASIATEAKIVEAMREEGVTKDDIGRDGFLERAWEWNRKYGGRIIEQLKKLGIRCIYLPIVAMVIVAVILTCLNVERGGDWDNLPSLVTGLLLILASLIFRYGAELEEKDKPQITEGN